MTRLALAILAATLATGSARAQYITTPDDNGGSFTIGPNGYLSQTHPLAGGAYYTLVQPGQPAAAQSYSGDRPMRPLQRGTSLDE